MSNRVFWFSNNLQGCRGDLECALQQGQQIEHFGVTDAGVLVITNGRGGQPNVQGGQSNDQVNPPGMSGSG